MTNGGGTNKIWKQRRRKKNDEKIGGTRKNSTQEKLKLLKKKKKTMKHFLLSAGRQNFAICGEPKLGKLGFFMHRNVREYCLIWG